jgi:hypothetical protein
MRKQTKQILLRSTNDNKYMKMFNILIHRENINQNYTEIPTHPSQNGYDTENKQQMLVRLGIGKEPTCTIGENLK